LKVIERPSRLDLLAIPCQVNRTQLFTVFDSGPEEPRLAESNSTMVLEVVTVLLAAAVGIIAVLYAAPRGYFGHRKKSSTPNPSPESHTSTPEQAIEFPPFEAIPVAEPAPSPAPAPAPYESVQPAPAPALYSPPSTTSFGAPTLAKKPTRTYRRRTAPIRSAAGSKRALTEKEKKR